jgi:hypothetical protein
VRPQAEPYGSRGFTTDYHDWHGEGGRCKFCGVSRAGAQVDVESRPRRGWRGLEVFQAEQELEQILAARPRSLIPYTPNPQRWASVTSLLAAEDR